MRRAHTTVLVQRISKAFEKFDEIPKQPLPERWVDLINYLNAQEEEQAKARPRAKHPPPLDGLADSKM